MGFVGQGIDEGRHADRLLAFDLLGNDTFYALELGRFGDKRVERRWMERRAGRFGRCVGRAVWLSIHISASPLEQVFACPLVFGKDGAGFTGSRGIYRAPQARALRGRSGWVEAGFFEPVKIFRGGLRLRQSALRRRAIRPTRSCGFRAGTRWRAPARASYRSPRRRTVGPSAGIAGETPPACGPIPLRS